MGVCHLSSLIWGSMFYWNCFYSTNPKIANQCFFMEWFDILIPLVVIFWLHTAWEDGDKKGTCHIERVATS